MTGVHPLCPTWVDEGVTVWEKGDHPEPILAHRAGAGRRWVMQIGDHGVHLSRLLEPTRKQGTWAVRDITVLTVDEHMVGAVVSDVDEEGVWGWEDDLAGPPGPPLRTHKMKWQAWQTAKDDAQRNTTMTPTPREWINQVSLLVLGVHPDNRGARAALEGVDLAALSPDDPEVLLALSVYPNP